MEHLSGLQETFLEYFPSQADHLSWVQNPFVESSDVQTLPIKEREQLIDISTDATLKTIFRQAEIVSFWIQIKNEYPEISERALKQFMPFVTNTSARDLSLFILLRKQNIEINLMQKMACVCN